MSPMTGETKADVPSAVARTVGTFPKRSKDEWRPNSPNGSNIPVLHLHRHVGLRDAY